MLSTGSPARPTQPQLPGTIGGTVGRAPVVRVAMVTTPRARTHPGHLIETGTSGTVAPVTTASVAAGSRAFAGLAVHGIHRHHDLDDTRVVDQPGQRNRHRVLPVCSVVIRQPVIRQHPDLLHGALGRHHHV